MGTEYKVFEDKETAIQISLYEMSCQFYVCVECGTADCENDVRDKGVASASTNRKYTEDEILDMAASLVGPLYYFSDKPDAILETLRAKLVKRGFT